MGGQGFVVQRLYTGVKTKGFQADSPSFPKRQLRFSVRDIELIKNALTSGDKTEYEAMRYIRTMMAVDVAKMRGEAEDDLPVTFFFSADDYANVTKAKTEVQEDRTKDARQKLTKNKKKWYSEEELATLVLPERFDSEEALKATPMLDMDRLRAADNGPAKTAARKRLNEFILHAAITTFVDERQTVEFVIDGKWHFYAYDAASPKALVLLNSRELPTGIAESEMICAHYVFSQIAMTPASMRGELAFMIHCKDTDIVMPLVVNVPRIITDDMVNSELAPAVWINLSSKSGDGPAEEEAPAAEKDEDGGGDDDKAFGKYQKKPYLDVIRVFYEFSKNCAAKTPETAPWNVMPNPLITMAFMAVIGGSEKVEKVAGATAEGTFVEFCKRPEIHSVLSASQRCIEVEALFEYKAREDGSNEFLFDTPVQRRIDQVVRVVVDEPAFMDIFMRICAYKQKRLEAGAKGELSGDVVTKILGTAETRSDETFQQALDYMIQFAAKHRKMFDDKVAEYAELERRKNAGEAVELGKKPTRYVSKPVPAQSLQELRGHIRRAVWQLTGETLNGMVNGGLPPCGQKDEATGKSKWGRKDDGTLENDIVPFSATMNLYN